MFKVRKTGGKLMVVVTHGGQELKIPFVSFFKSVIAFQKECRDASDAVDLQRINAAATRLRPVRS